MKLFISLIHLFIVTSFATYGLNDSEKSVYNEDHKTILDSNIERHLVNLKSAKASNQQEAVLENLIHLSNLYLDQSNYKRANSYLLELSNFSFNQFPKQAIDFYLAKGRLYLRIRNYEEAIASFYKALKESDHYSVKGYKKPEVHYYLGMVNFENQNFEEGRKNCHLALDILKQSPNDSLKVFIFNGLGFGSRDYHQSNQWFFKSLKIYKSHTYQFDPTLIGNMYNNIASNYGDLGMRDSSQYYFQKSYLVHKKNHFIKGIIFHHLNFGFHNSDIGQFGRAKAHLDSAKTLIDINPQDEYYSALYGYYSRLYLKIGDYKMAYDFLSRKNEYFSRANSKEIQEKIASIKSSYEIEKENSELKNDIKIQLLESKKNTLQKNLFLVGYGFVTIIILLLIFQIWQYKKNKKKSENLQSILDKIENTLIVLNKNGQVEWMNKHAKDLIHNYSTGTDIKELERSFLMSGLESHFNECIQTKQNVFYTNSYQKDGSTFWWQIGLSPILDKTGHLTRVVIKDSNITPLIKIEKELKIKNEELKKIIHTRDKFFSVVAHDLRSPIKSFLKVSRFLVDPTKRITESQKNDMASSLTESAEYMSDLLENLLQWSVTQTGGQFINPSFIDLSLLVENQIHHFEKHYLNKSIHLDFTPNNDINVFADKNMLETVIRNLLTNAIKFTNSKGKISINIVQNGNQVQLSIKDNGVGMSPSIQSKLFKIEEKVSMPGTHEEKGTGLGLLICKEYIDSNQGAISFMSKEDKGSTFIVTLQKQSWAR